MGEVEDDRWEWKLESEEEGPLRQAMRLRKKWEAETAGVGTELGSHRGPEKREEEEGRGREGRGGGKRRGKRKEDIEP